MVQSKAGALKAKKTRIERLGGAEAYHIAMQNTGKIGGSKGAKDGVIKGFAAMSPEKRREAGRAGGKKSRRSVKKAE